MKKLVQNTIHSQKVFYRYFRRKGFKRFLKENILETEGTNELKAKSIALGILIGFSPFWGFHSLLAISLSIYFRMNKMLTFMASQITFPPLIPIIILLSMIAGSPFVAETASIENRDLDLEFIKDNLIQYLIGSAILSVSCSLIFGTLSFFILEKLNPGKSNMQK